jgi:two-component system response regulator MprA
MMSDGQKCRPLGDIPHNEIGAEMAFSILVVEDDRELRELVCLMLQHNGFEVEEAVDGLDALAKMASWQPDAMVLDVMMPRMDGLTVCRKLRQVPETAELPVVMISGRAQNKAVAEGLAAGANKYLVKPMSLDLLVKCIQELLPYG